MGNRISHKYRTDSAIGYAHDKANRMTTLATKTQGYDLAGNLTLAYSADRGTSYVYRWDHHNRLTGVYDSTNTTRKAAFTWDALGRRVETINDKLGTTTRYYYDGDNEVVEDNQSATRQRYYVHGISYVDERLMMYNDGDSRPYYYVLDRMFNVRALIDRAGAIVERIAYDGYGQPLIRESAGRGDMNNSTTIVSGDETRFDSAKAASIWDPRADLDDDGDVDSTDETLFDAKRPTWDPAGLDFPPGVAQAFSDVDNPYLFQGVPHFALDTAANDTSGKLMLNHHRARFADPVAGRWGNRDPLVTIGQSLTPNYQTALVGSLLSSPLPSPQYPELDHISWTEQYGYSVSNPINNSDPSGLAPMISGCHPLEALVIAGYIVQASDILMAKSAWATMRAGQLSGIPRRKMEDFASITRSAGLEMRRNDYNVRCYSQATGNYNNQQVVLCNIPWVWAWTKFRREGPLPSNYTPNPVHLCNLFFWSAIPGAQRGILAHETTHHYGTVDNLGGRLDEWNAHTYNYVVWFYPVFNPDIQ